MNMSMHAEDEDDFEVCKTMSCSTTATGEHQSTVERTILAMMETGVCLHPTHSHSFQQVNFMVGLYTCAGCKQRLQTLVLGGGPFSSVGTDSSKHVVRCVACGALAHRSCALQSTYWRDDNICPVNSLVQQRQRNKNLLLDDDEYDICDNQSSPDRDSGRSSNSRMISSIRSSSDTFCSGRHDEPELIHSHDSSLRNTAISIDKRKHLDRHQQPPPPPPKVTSIALPQSDSEPDNNVDDDDDQNCVHVQPLHVAKHPFASISNAIQENVAAHYRKRQQEQLQLLDSPSLLLKATASVQAAYEPQGERLQKKYVNNPKLGTVVAVAGGIAGGMAGLAMAGPAGAYAGYLGSYAGVLGLSGLGVILEGSVTLGVVVAGVAMGGTTAKQIQEQMMEAERRVLTMGEDESSRKVLLVRPNICTDPVWEDIYREARQAAPKHNQLITGFTFLNQVNTSHQDRYRREADIVETLEDEIPTSDKVLLLVSRLLNDKKSLPGYVYRYLIDSFHDRCKARQEKMDKRSASEDDQDDELMMSLVFSPRARRADVHAVIKYVTATLLEVKPGLASSPQLTELAATAVEGLVFGQLYDLVFDEIKTETADRDLALLEKIALFQRQNLESSAISTDALLSLKMLPESHLPVDKLFDCVKFLEHISSHFSSLSERHTGPCADSLLKMACQHIIVAALSDLNAQVSFLEEFARDEQLLRGREGYSLVTLQASLHFLNMSSDLDDIFRQDDEEENVPVSSQRSGDITHAAS